MHKTSNGRKVLTDAQWFGLGAIKVSNGEPVWPEGGPHAEASEKKADKAKTSGSKKPRRR